MLDKIDRCVIEHARQELLAALRMPTSALPVTFYGDGQQVGIDLSGLYLYESLRFRRDEIVRLTTSSPERLALTNAYIHAAVVANQHRLWVMAEGARKRRKEQE